MVAFRNIQTAIPLLLTTLLILLSFQHSAAAITITATPANELPAPEIIIDMPTLPPLVNITGIIIDDPAPVWTFCVNEWRTCRPPVPALVRYGANNLYFFQQANESIKCSNGTFGNPAGSASKSCDYLLSSTTDYDDDGAVDNVDTFPNNASESVDTDGDGFGDNADPFPQDASNNASGNWVHCANEWTSCRPPAPALVRYGANNLYFFQQANESIQCSNGTFGNPAGSSGKRCDYLLSSTADFDGDGVLDSADTFPNNNSESADTDGDGFGDNADPFPQDASNNASGNWVHCANEWTSCRPPAPALVRYGANNLYFFQQANESIQCSNGTFGNPAGSSGKRCDYLLSSTADFDGDGVLDSADTFPNNASESADTDGDGFGDNADPFPQDATNNTSGNWVHCANEWTSCRPPAPALVRYGANDLYFFQQANESIQCSNGTFGNPTRWNYKSCDYLLSSTADFDGDGVLDSADTYPNDATESADTDGDGFGDNADPFPQDATNNAGGNWVHCANEWTSCRPPAPALVRYGANDLYFFQQADESIQCSNGTFGNPTRWNYKSCDYLLSSTADFDGDGVFDNVDLYPNNANESADTDGDGFGDNADPFPLDATNNASGNWVHCANEWTSCRPPAPALVRYGANDLYFFQEANASIQCSNGTFGNPAGSSSKSCDYLLSSTADFDGDGVLDNVDLYPNNANESADTDGDGFGDNADPFPLDATNNASGNWVHCANEWTSCRPPTPALVRYGANDLYFYQQAGESIQCSNGTFGNPAGNASKRCDYLVQIEDADNDTVADTIDNCPSDANTDQADIDGDNIGDVCDFINNSPTWDDFSWGEATWQ